MLPDLHMHTCFSHDGAKHSTVAALCERAIELGLPAIAVTDHFDLNHELATPPRRTLPRQQIFEAVRQAQQTYGDRLQILLGVELGQANQFPERAKELMREYPYDLVLGSLHSLPERISFSRTDFNPLTEAEYNALFAEVLQKCDELLDLGVIHVLAHLTYMHRYLHRAGKPLNFALFREQMEALFKKMIAQDVGLEINTSTVKEGITMPTLEILQFYRDCGGRLLAVGSDTHKPESLAKGFEVARDMLLACGYTSLDVPTANGVLSFPI